MRLSIVITAYNVENHIKRALQSLIGQTIKEFEVIVVDDGSTDGTYGVASEIMNGFQVTEHKIVSGENGGVSAARNRGLMEASGEYIMFLDGDDYAADNLVESIYHSLSRQEADVVCWGFNTVDEDQIVLADYFDSYEYSDCIMTGAEALRRIFSSRIMWLCTGSAAFRKEILIKNQLCYTEGCVNGEDQEFSIKALSGANRVVFLNEILSFYVQRPSSITNSCNVRKFDAINALKRAVCYLINSNDEELVSLAHTIQTQHLVENYFNNLDSCMLNSSMKILKNQMNDSYPGLNREMKGNMKRYLRETNEFTRYHIKCGLCLISPELYSAFVLIKRKAINLRKVG